MQRDRILDVPYFVQPTTTTCQATCLKMLCVYLERTKFPDVTGGPLLSPEKIKQEINGGAGRPDTVQQNSHANFAWWLKSRYQGLKVENTYPTGEDKAAEKVVDALDRGFPVLCGVSHSLVNGHIVLAIGYTSYEPNVSSSQFKIIVHDPYGRFDPSLAGSGALQYGSDRYLKGISFLSGGEDGPGKCCALTIDGIGRRTNANRPTGNYYTMILRT